MAIASKTFRKSKIGPLPLQHFPKIRKYVDAIRCLNRVEQASISISSRPAQISPKFAFIRTLDPLPNRDFRLSFCVLGGVEVIFFCVSKCVQDASGAKDTTSGVTFPVPKLGFGHVYQAFVYLRECFSAALSTIYAKVFFWPEETLFLGLQVCRGSTFRH